MRAADPDLEIGGRELERSILALPLTSSNALARIGIVLRFSTIDWIRPRPRWNSLFSIENFMLVFPWQRADVVLFSLMFSTFNSSRKKCTPAGTTCSTAPTVHGLLDCRGVRTL
jgi:hypothetical protein